MELRSKWTDLIPDTGLKISEVFDQGDLLYKPGVASILNVTTGEGAFKKILCSFKKAAIIRGKLRRNLSQSLASIGI